ncbi:MAG: diguanylate cyclase, partial [Pseudomonas sp.]|nr:diguanylate cyclase [Pseudomonas sp.]
FNDHYGHIQGDDCLKSVGQALSRAASRPRDFVGRFGGEEFVLVLPDTDEAAARHIAERCRQQVRQQRIAHERSSVSSLLTISLGVGTIVPGAHDRPLDFLNSVDKLLYQAKQRGRDRLEVAKTPARSTLDDAADARA